MTDPDRLDDQITAAAEALRHRRADAAEPIIAVTCIRDEQAVVERRVRRNLAVVDGLIVVDQRSRDRTPDIPAALIAEGRPLATCRASLPGKRQADSMSRMARVAPPVCASTSSSTRPRPTNWRRPSSKHGLP